ncbi:MAG TPA: peptidoglycan editing factor PgeF [Burkholderiaceae bacterium]|nr:peptidoglycan editing factor PgeF [Burkholderiaceae bacterium]
MTGLPSPLGFAPTWDAPARVRALITTRAGGVSRGAYADANGGGGLNLGAATDDAPGDVAENRRRLAAALPQPPRWMRLVHGNAVADAEAVDAMASTPTIVADAATSMTPGVVCCVTMADCLPVLLASRRGDAVGVAHAGWRGLAGGVIQATVRQLRRRLRDPGAEIVACLGPAIGPAHFEVGQEVFDAMQQTLPDAAAAFATGADGRLRADLFVLARQALAQVGVASVRGGGECTYANPWRYYSHRRDRVTGRHAALVWIDAPT